MRQATPHTDCGPHGLWEISAGLGMCGAIWRHNYQCDALQVFENWRVLSARPDAADEARAKHFFMDTYPMMRIIQLAWLREVNRI